MSDAAWRFDQLQRRIAHDHNAGAADRGGGLWNDLTGATLLHGGQSPDWPSSRCGLRTAFSSERCCPNSLGHSARPGSPHGDFAVYPVSSPPILETLLARSQTARIA